MSSVPHRLLPVAAALVLTVACAAIGGGDPNVAASVGDETISTTRVEDTLDQFRESEAFQQQEASDESGEFVLDLQSQIVSAFIQSELLEVTAESEGIEVSDDDVQSALDDIVEQTGGQEAFDDLLATQGITEEFATRQVRDQQLAQGIQESIGEETELVEWLREETSDIPIEVNPRYGSWDSESFTVVREDASTPEPTSSP